MKNSQNSSCSVYSKSTVSKVLNHQYGVNGETRRAILKQYENILPKSATEEVDIYFILPETPAFFWRCALPVPQSRDVHIKYNIYSRITDTDIVLYYLEDAVRLNAKAVVLAAMPNDEIKRAATKIAESRLVIFVNELINAKNTFFVGADPYADGKTLAKYVKKIYAGSNKLLLLGTKIETASKTLTERRRGFEDEIAGNVPYSTLIFSEAYPAPALTAVLARTLAEYLKNDDFYGIVCFDGYTSSLCAALLKLKNTLNLNAICFGFEDDPKNEAYTQCGILNAVMAQSLKQQLDTAAALAELYVKTGSLPENRFTYTLPKLITY